MAWPPLSAARACIAKDGDVRVLPKGAQKCKRGETPLAWSKTGPAGASGASGASGADGAAGPAGPQEPAGPASRSTEPGPQGEPGPAGPAGPAGPKGDRGLTGLKGDKGDTGAQGATGAQGPQGPQGATGAQGPQGPQGATGPAGPGAGFASRSSIVGIKPLTTVPAEGRPDGSLLIKAPVGGMELVTASVAVAHAEATDMPVQIVCSLCQLTSASVTSFDQFFSRNHVITLQPGERSTFPVLAGGRTSGRTGGNPKTNAVGVQCSTSSSSNPTGGGVFRKAYLQPSPLGEAP